MGGSLKADVDPSAPVSAKDALIVSANTTVVNDSFANTPDRSSKSANNIAVYEEFKRKAPVDPSSAQKATGLNRTKCANLAAIMSKRVRHAATRTSPFP